MNKKLKLGFWPKLIIGTIIILHIIYIAIDYLFHFEIDGFKNMYLKSIINSASGMPYYQYKYYKNDSDEIINIPEKDWYDVGCYKHYIDSAVGLNANYMTHESQYEEIEALPKDKLEHLQCLATRGYGRKESKPFETIRTELCTNYFNCRIFAVWVKDYVFKHPDILWNMTKIAEKPCDYIDTLENIKKKTSLDPSKREHSDEYIQKHIDGAKRELNCNYFPQHWWRPREEYVVLAVLKDPQKSIREPHDTMYIVVKRKDV